MNQNDRINTWNAISMAIASKLYFDDPTESLWDLAWKYGKHVTTKDNINEMLEMIDWDIMKLIMKGK